MADHSSLGKGAMDMLAELEQDESKEKVEEFLLSLDGLGFFTSEVPELFEVQKTIHNKIAKLLGNINLLADQKLADLLENFHKKLGGTIEKNRKSFQSVLAPIPMAAPVPVSVPKPPAFKMPESDKKEFLLTMALGELEGMLKPVYSILEKDPKKVPAGLRVYLEQIQPVCKSFIEGGIEIGNPEMSMDEQESKAEEIKKLYAKIEPRIKRYLSIEKEMTDAEIDKAHSEGLKENNEKKETKAKAEAEKRDEIAKAEAKKQEEHGEALEMNKKMDADKRLGSLSAETLFKEVLVKPDDFKSDSKNPVIQAVIGLAKDFDKQKLGELTATLRTSEKIPSPSQAKKIKEMMDKGVTTSDELDKKITSLDEEIDRGDGVVDNLNSQIAQQTTIIQSMRGNVDPKDKDNLKNLNEKLTAEKAGLRELRNQLKTCNEIKPFIGGNKMSPRQLLLRLIKFKEGDRASIEKMGEMADDLVAEEERKLAPKIIQGSGITLKKGWRGGLKNFKETWTEGLGTKDKYLRMIKPSLKATLAEFSKIEALGGMKPEDLEVLLKLRNDPSGLMVWVDKLKEKAKTVIPTLMAYLQMAIVEGTLNKFSRVEAMELLKNLRSIRNKRILSQINGKPELRDAKPEVRMQAYLTEMNEWDEKSVLVNRDIIEDLVTKSYVSKGVKTLIGATAIALIGPGTILHIALQHMGWKIGAIGGAIAGEKMVKSFRPEWETKYKHTVPRLVGWGILGPLGLLAPELMSGTKFAYKKYKGRNEKGEKEGGSIKWAIASGVGRMLAYPLKKLFGKKMMSLPKPKIN